MNPNFFSLMRLAEILDGLGRFAWHIFMGVIFGLALAMIVFPFGG